MSYTNIVANTVVAVGPDGGLYVYDPVEALGNLIASITDAPVSPTGDTTVKGITAYVVIFGNTHAISLNQPVGPGTPAPGLSIQELNSQPSQPGGIFGFVSATAAQITVSSGTETSTDIDGQIILESAVAAGLTGGGLVNINGAKVNLAQTVVVDNNARSVTVQGTETITKALTATGGTPASPTQIATDTWQPVSPLPVGLTGTIRVKLLPLQNMAVLDVNVTIGSTSTTATTFALTSLPSAAYYPTGQRQYPVSVNQGTGTAPASPRVNIPASGNLALDIPPFATAGNTCLVSGTVVYPLD